MGGSLYVCPHGIGRDEQTKAINDHLSESVPGKLTLGGRLTAGRLLRGALGINGISWKGKGQDWAPGEVELQCSLGGRF